MDFMSSFPSIINPNTTIQITIGGDINSPAYVNGGDIKDLIWYFKIPKGLIPFNEPVISSIFPQGTVIKGDGTFGKISVGISKKLIRLKASGIIRNQAKFIPPAFNISFIVSTSINLPINIVSNSNPAYSVDAGITNIDCSRNGKKVSWTQMVFNTEL